MTNQLDLNLTFRLTGTGQESWINIIFSDGVISLLATQEQKNKKVMCRDIALQQIDMYGGNAKLVRYE